MYGTIMRARVKKGELGALERLFEEQRSSVERSPGFHSIEFAREDKDPDRVVAVIHFTDRESYFKNASRPETDANYRKMLQHLESAPEWIDVHYARFYGRPLDERTLAAARKT